MVLASELAAVDGLGPRLFASATAWRHGCIAAHRFVATRVDAASNLCRTARFTGKILPRQAGLEGELDAGQGGAVVNASALG